MDTIFAVSSGAPPAAIAVLRLSGPDALSAATRLAGAMPPPRRAGLRVLHAADGTLLDRALVLVFPGPASATGEDLVELHLHGGRAVVRAVSAALATQPGLREAEPGEFTRRALANGRIDLTEAEGLGDLLAAETEQQRRAALRMAEGGLSRAIGEWTDQLLDIAARLEAALDFSDEDDVPADALGPIVADALALGSALQAAADATPVERLRDGVRVVLAGPPNSGKSSLFNALADREAAIVSAIAGTTRDRIEAPITRDGIAYLLIDTAGLAVGTADPIEAIGIARARDAMASGDVVLWLGDTPPPANALALHARADLSGRRVMPAGRLAVSATTGEGLAALWSALAERAQALLPKPDEMAINARQRQLLGEAADALQGCADETDAIVIAERLRWARQAFDTLTGRADVEGMLDALFSRFCIGK